MTTPVSNSIQGAYVVAVVCTGLILGGGALVFKEMTESLGCLLGGFCVAMWLLTLHDGGLITNSMGKIIFVIVLAACGFALYFSRWTRAYALIGSISFSGATAMVLGLDCFTRAGLKEFWAYIWALNENLFPYGADTYPLTKGIRVEIALIVILCVAGIISQLKLWKVIQEHRIKRKEEQDEAEVQRELEEANVGRQIEEQAARERREWEARYGDRSPGSPIGSGDSGVSELNEKKTARESQTIVGCASDDDNDIELAELPGADTKSPDSASVIERPAGAVLTTKDEEGRVIVRVAADDDAEVAAQGADGADVRPTSSVSVRNQLKSPQPEITNLPFRIPDGEADDDDRSSCATFADDDDRSLTLEKRASRMSVGNRLSVETGRILSRLSARSLVSNNSRATAGDSSLVKSSPAFGESHEVLVSDVGKVDDSHSASGSVDATGDDSSVHSRDNDHKSVKPDFAMEITADLGDRESHAGTVSTAKDPNALKPKSAGKQADIRSHSPAETVGTDILNVSVVEGHTEATSKRGTADAPGPEAEVAKPGGDAVKPDDGAASPEADAAAGQTEASTEKQAQSPAKSETKSEGKGTRSKRQSTDSTSASLSKNLLPKNLSRVTSAYRTNEWAKHLSQADTPEPERLQIDQVASPDEVPADTEDGEAAAPVNIESLQQTAETGAPAPAVVHIPSTLANSAQPAGFLHRSDSRISSTPGHNIGVSTVMGQSHDWSPPGKPGGSHPPQASQKYRNRDPNRDSLGHYSDTTNPQSMDGYASGALQPAERMSSEHQFDQQGMFRPPVPGIVPYSSPQTLLGKRDMLIRQRSSIMNGPGPETRVFSAPVVTPSDMESVHNYPVYDVDDLPLSQRKELMRRSSLLSSSGSHAHVHGVPYIAHQQPPMTDAVAMASHQPQRMSTLQPTAVRESQLASFRQSVANDLRSGMAVYSPPVNGRELRTSISMNALGGGAFVGGQANRDTEVRHRMDQSRHVLLSQRDMESQRREAERMEKERNERMFEEHMRSGYLMDAHRDAMRRMQSGARET